MQTDLKAGSILRAAFPDVDSDDPVSYLGRTGDLFHALSYAWLFWPRLVELYGAVFLALHGDDEKEIRERLATPVGDAHPEWPPMSWKDAVDSYNRFEISYLFRFWREPSNLISDAAEVLSGVLVQTWRARLLQAYPERVFSVSVVEYGDATELSIEVCQQSPDLEVPDRWNERRRFIEPPGASRSAP
ncbi:MAG: hypothetical protein ACRDJG_09390 [Actinomycetota bacterium]